MRSRRSVPLGDRARLAAVIDGHHGEDRFGHLFTVAVAMAQGPGFKLDSIDELPTRRTSA